MDFEPDYIVVGSGAGGGVLASRLAEERGNKVLLLEAGPDNTGSKLIQEGFRFPLLYDLPVSSGGPLRSPSHWGFMTTPQEGKSYCYPRGTGLGGSVNHHVLIDGRGSPTIYNNWAEITGDRDWHSDNLARIFRGIENYNVPGANPEVHGKEGWLYVRKARGDEEFFDPLRSLIADEFNLPEVNGAGENPESREEVYQSDVQMHEDGRRAYVATDLIKPTCERNKKAGWNNFEIVTDSLVTRVIFEGKRAVGVEVIDAPRAYQVDAAHKKRSRKGPRKIYRARKEVILCGGSINTPQILMLSGVGPAKHLEEVGVSVLHDLPGVGEHLQDHIECSVNFELSNIPNRIWGIQGLFAGMVNPYWKWKAPKTAISDASIALIYDYNSGIGEVDPLNPDLHVHVVRGPLRDFNLNPPKHRDPDPNKAAWTEGLKRYAHPFNPRPILNFLAEVMRGEEGNGTIRLNSLDPTDAPVIDLRLCDNADEIARLAKGIQDARNLMARPELAKYNPTELIPGTEFPNEQGLRDYVRRYSSFGHHMSGTCKMGADPMAVVDHNLKVHGLEGLRICDTSICPTPPGYNTSRPTYMIGEVLAEKMKRGS